MIESAPPSSTPFRGDRRGSRLEITATRNARSFRTLLAVAIGLGLACRATQYAAERSLWFDEAALALNILHRSATGLTGTLDFAQAAPLGFLELEKLATHAFGDSELALRLLPFLCGLASVPLFAALALRFLRPAPVLLATLLFACAKAPVYYASELKQYSGDVAVAIGLTLLATLFLDDALSGPAKVAASLAGVAAMSLSHASVFVAGGIALTLAARALLRRDRGAFETAAATVPWVVMGVFVVIFTDARTSRLNAVIGSQSSAYGRGSALGSQVDWVRDVTSALLRSIGYTDGPGRYLHWPLLALATVGGIGLARRHPTRAALLILPFAVTWVATAVHRYPVFDRTTLFLVPATVLLVAEGVAVLASAARLHILRIIAASALGSLVLLVPLVQASKGIADPRQHEEIKQTLAYIRRHWQPGEALFVDRGARFALRYYLDCGCFPAAEVRGRDRSWRFGQLPGGHGTGPVPLRQIDARFVVGRLDVTTLSALKRQLDGLVGRPRVWILYTHTADGSQMLRIGTALQLLNRRTRRLDSFAAVGAHAYLYDLRLRSR